MMSKSIMAFGCLIIAMAFAGPFLQDQSPSLQAKGRAPAPEVAVTVGARLMGPSVVLEAGIIWSHQPADPTFAGELVLEALCDAGANPVPVRRLTAAAGSSPNGDVQFGWELWAGQCEGGSRPDAIAITFSATDAVGAVFATQRAVFRYTYTD